MLLLPTFPRGGLGDVQNYMGKAKVSKKAPSTFKSPQAFVQGRGCRGMHQLDSTMQGQKQNT